MATFRKCSIEAKIKTFNFMENCCSIFLMFSFLYFKPFHQLQYCVAPMAHEVDT